MDALFILIWIVAIVTTNGPGTIVSRERAPFKDQAACHAFAKSHTDRMADYARGVAHLDWDDPVKVAYRCNPVGQGI